jgi:hypothetical protein
MMDLLQRKSEKLYFQYYSQESVDRSVEVAISVETEEVSTGDDEEFLGLTLKFW